MSKRVEDCHHYWKVVGPQGRRWHVGYDDIPHSLAKCMNCLAWTVVDRAGVGPCEHSVGQYHGEQLFRGEPPLEKERGGTDEDAIYPREVCAKCGKEVEVLVQGMDICADCEWKAQEANTGV